MVASVCIAMAGRNYVITTLDNQMQISYADLLALGMPFLTVTIMYRRLQTQMTLLTILTALGMRRIY